MIKKFRLDILTSVIIAGLFGATLASAQSGNSVIHFASPFTQNLIFTPDATFDIGASGATRPRNLFMSGNLNVAGASIIGGANSYQFNGRATINSPSDGVLQWQKNAGGQFTVAQLPSASTSGANARVFVTDANAVTFNSIVAGGGSNGVPVYSDGTNWRIG